MLAKERLRLALRMHIFRCTEKEGISVSIDPNYIVLVPGVALLLKNVAIKLFNSKRSLGTSMSLISIKTIHHWVIDVAK